MQSTSRVDDCLAELAVGRLFIFLKKTLNFEYFQDDFIQINLLTEKELKGYVLIVHEYFRTEKFLKLMIKKRRCKEFVAFMLELPHHHHTFKHRHITEEIRKFMRYETHKASKSSKEQIPPFPVSDELLRKHFHLLNNVLEPRDIADEMFQAGQISVNDHDDITDDLKKYNRMENLLDVLKRKQLNAPFLCLLESLNYTSLLESLSTDRQPVQYLSEYAVCIQRSFTTLQTQLQEAILTTMRHVLTGSDVSDIDRCSDRFRKISKLMKILISKGHDTCEKLFGAIERIEGRKDLIEDMITKSAYLVRRGKPDLKPSLRCLTISRLKEFEVFLYDELEPIVICDYLFEESAVDITSHDKITEPTRRRKRTERLLKTVEENKHDCFHFFLYIIQNMLPFICQELEKSTPSPIEVDGVPNDPIQLKLTVKYCSGARVEQILYQHIHSFDTGFLKEVITRQIDIESVTSIGVVMQIPPLTSSAVSSQLADNDRWKLSRLFSKMVEEAETGITEVLKKPSPLRIKMEIHNYPWKIPKSDETISKATLIKKRIIVYRNALLYELDPTVLLFALSKYKAFPKEFLESLPIGCFERIERILAFVENGSDEVAKEFVRALNDLDYNAMAEMIDPSDAKSKAENIRKRISSNYKDVLDEIELSLARETLSKCTGDIDAIMEKILPQNGNRRQRMSEFLHFVLQDDINLIEFERTLKRNNLENIIDTWTEDLDSKELKILLESFDIVVQNYLEATRAHLKGSELTKCVEEVKSLAKNIVLCKDLKGKNKKPGTVCVFEVIVKDVDDQLFIDEKDSENWDAFFNKRQNDLVKVILIEGTWNDIRETKTEVTQKYKQYMDSETFHLHHVSEKNDEVVKFIAHQKIKSYQQYVESQISKIPLSNLEDIVSNVTDRVITKKKLQNCAVMLILMV